MFGPNFQVAAGTQRIVSCVCGVSHESAAYVREQDRLRTAHQLGLYRTRGPGNGRSRSRRWKVVNDSWEALRENRLPQIAAAPHPINRKMSPLDTAENKT